MPRESSGQSPQCATARTLGENRTTGGFCAKARHHPGRSPLGLAAGYRGYTSFFMAQQLPWWADHLVIPIMFVLLGAGIGFGVGQLTGWLERRRTKRAFLRAIRLELQSLQEQLQATLDELEGSKERLQRGVPAPPEIIGAIRNTVFTSQLGRISDLSDPLIIDIVKLYSDLSILTQFVEVLNRHGRELSKDDGIAQQAQRTRRVLGDVTGLSLYLHGFLQRIEKLVAQLPAGRCSGPLRR